jgi:hypothetical protein
MRFTGTTVLRLNGGKIVEEIGLDDGVTALQQLGLLKAAWSKAQRFRSLSAMLCVSNATTGRAHTGPLWRYPFHWATGSNQIDSGRSAADDRPPKLAAP